MASSTTNKKEIVDFLWDWAESHGDWAKLLVQKVVDNESNLHQSEREEVFKYFLESIGLEKDLPELTFSKPSYTPTNQHVELSSLSDVTGVNKLAKNQTIDFSPNITVIYGENGTGKTGYGRILKALGFSYDQNNTIYANVFAQSQQPKSATINYKVNGNADTFTWDGTNKDEDLKNISVFNSDCVQISLDASRQLIVSPIGFHLFNLVSAELGELDSLLQTKKSDHPTQLLWVDNLHEGTPQHQFIKSLSKDSTEKGLNELSDFNPEHEEDLKKKKTELSKLNKSLIQNEIRSLRSQSDELSKLVNKIKAAQNTLNVESWKKLIELNKRIAELEKSAKKGIKEIAEDKGIEYYETEEFKRFLSSAEAYIKILDNPEYPEQSDVCVYCRQPLEQPAKELLSSYRALLNDKTEENITKAKKEKQELISKIKNEVEARLQLNHESFGLDEKDKPIQPQKLQDYNQKLADLKKTFVDDNVAQDSVFLFKYADYILFFTEKKSEIDKTLKEKSELLGNLDKKEKELKAKIAELKDRKLLSSKKEEVKKAISNHKVLSVLNNHSNAFNTASISRKTSQAREELVSQNFNQIFKDELKSLRKSNLPIELSFGTNRGRSKLSHHIGNKQLLEILSEGEQKAIALSEFLTELQLDNVKAPVIFDDPVNSLDHKIIDAVARRLMRLSKERQVVIFTHSVLLFNSLLYLSSEPNFKSLNCNFYNVKKEYGLVGVVTEAEEEKNKVKENISKINILVNNTPKDRSEVDVAKEGYAELRSAVELFVEHEVFNGTVQRYQKHISIGRFMNVKSDIISNHKESLNDIYDRCCGFIGAHSNPQVVYNDPTLDDLKSDFDEFKDIRKKFV
ncbi:AAA family ATPase [Roseivirga sp. UBA838]|uniref:AAA family ATPase n=1 Tax=Roseivirga sp. UBA838 TaxID=1947393 RepID=UPI0025801328|nr:AAA family ATPase [Roseivirga sp. UBA838]|tara:strand:- start:4074 stop:6635 length:2562 start_codon:yes stop_codon:yes gene_type:complete